MKSNQSQFYESLRQGRVSSARTRGRRRRHRALWGLASAPTRSLPGARPATQLTHALSITLVYSARNQVPDTQSTLRFALLPF